MLEKTIVPSAPTTIDTCIVDGVLFFHMLSPRIEGTYGALAKTILEELVQLSDK